MLFCLSGLHAQVSGNYQYNTQQTLQSAGTGPASYAAIPNNDEVVITVNGLMNIAADNFVAVFNIVQVGETIDSTDQIMNRRIAKFRDALGKAGVGSEDIKVDMLSFVPKFDIQVENRLFSKTYNEIPAGYELQKNISVRYDNPSKLEDIVTAAVNAEVYDLVKVDYFIPDTQKSLDSLRKICLQEIQKREKTYAMLGFRLDTLKKVMADNFMTVYPQSRYFKYQAFSRPSLLAAKKKQSSSNVNEVPKTNSQFYSPVDYSQYDIILDPVVTEPVVQISCSVVVKYFLKPDVQPKNVYYILTDEGELKQIFPN